MSNRLLAALAWLLVVIVTPAAAAPIHEAVKTVEWARVAALIAADTSLVNARDESGRTPLHWAARDTSVAMVRLLVERGADVNAIDGAGVSPLHSLAVRGNVEGARLLLAKGAAVDARMPDQSTPLHLAARRGQTAVLGLLVAHRADLEGRDDYQRTPLVLAARDVAGVDVIRALLDLGADAEAADRFGDTALTLAAWRGSADVVALLLERNAPIPADPAKRRQLFEQAARNGLDALFSRLVGSGADLRAPVSDGGTLLGLAAHGGSLAILDTLLARGAAVNERDANGWTALHAAADLGRRAAVELLLARGADPRARTLMGQTACNLAEDNGDEETKAFLVARGVPPGPPAFPVLGGPYLGQKPPGRRPEVFAPGIVSGRYGLHANPVFSPDGNEVFWSVMVPPRGDAPVGRTLVSRLEAGRWTCPREAVLAGTRLEDVPLFHPDGGTLYDMARRPFPGGVDTGKENIWAWRRGPAGWTDPTPLDAAVNEPPHHWQFGVARNGDLYFATNVAGSAGGNDIYVSRRVQGRYLKPENLGPAINTVEPEEQPYVSPDGTTLLFARSYDIHASFRAADGTWTKARSLGPAVNTGAMELLPLLSPDGRYLFFSRHQDAWWMDAAFLDSLRGVELSRVGKASAAEEIGRALAGGDTAGAWARFEAMRGAEADSWFVDEMAMNALGYRFLREQKTAAALAAFEMNTRAFPGSWNVWDSYGGACAIAGDDVAAQAHYERSLELKPDNQSAREGLERIRAHELERAGETRDTLRFAPGAPTRLRGPYLGQKPPGTEPRVFAPGIVSSATGYEFSVSFTPDGREMYFTRRAEPGGENRIMVCRREKRGWSVPEEAACSKGFPSHEPHVTPDGRRLYFGSSRPRPEAAREYGIWVVERTPGGGWGEPRWHGPGMNVSVSRAGDLYLTRISSPAERGVVVYPSAGDTRGAQVRLGGGVNEPRAADHAFIAPDGEYLLFDSAFRPGGMGASDLYVCFREADGGWGEAFPLGHGVNTAATCFCPSVSPDGKYIFYCTNRDIWWVSATVLDPLRARARAGALARVVDGHNHALSTDRATLDSAAAAGLRARGVAAVVAGLPVNRARPADLESRLRREIDSLRAGAVPGVTLAEEPLARAAGGAGREVRVIPAIEWPDTIFRGDPSSVRRFRDLGVRLIGLNERDPDGLFGRGDSSAALTPFGRRIVAGLNEAGILIDVTHLLPHARKLSVIEASAVPVVASHSLARSMTPVDFSLPEEVIAALARSGGSVWVSFNRMDLLGDLPDAEAFDRLVSNIELFVRRLGEDRVGIGTDFQSAGRYVPAPLARPDAFLEIERRLRERGFSERAIEGVLGGNVLRALTAARAKVPAAGPAAAVPGAGPDAAPDPVSVAVQSSGPFRVRSYLVWDRGTREAALVDPGSDVDRLLDTLRSEGLTLRYLLLTHGHQDHVASLPAVRRAFPEARLCYARREWESLRTYSAWRTLYDSASVANWESARELMDLDYAGVPAPDVALKDGQTLRLGRGTIRVLETPGHSRGGLTFAVGRHLFPGDLVLYHQTGYMEYALASREQTVTSIRRLYALFPDETAIHAGHGKDSSIGVEERTNKTVTATEVRWSP